MRGFGVTRRSRPGGKLGRWAAVMAASVALLGAAETGPAGQAPATAPTPPWWSGNCDVNNHSGSYPLAASYNGVEACGPGPLQGGYDKLVHFFPGAWGEYEWECVELVARYMYLVYGIHPYSANGNTVVSNYSGSVLSKVSNDGASLPSPGDIVSEADTTTNPDGHTGVVTAVNVSDGTGTVTIMEQNASASGWGTIGVSGNVLGSLVTGWLHNAAAPADEIVIRSGSTLLAKTGATGTWLTEAGGLSSATPILAAGDLIGYIEKNSSGTPVLWAKEGISGTWHDEYSPVNAAVFTG
jgi:CHAP domain